MSVQTKPSWAGPTLLASLPKGQVEWSHQISEPSQVGRLGVSLVSALSKCGAAARLAELQLVSIGHRGNISCLSSKKDQVLVAQQWQRSELKEAESAIEQWRTTPPPCSLTPQREVPSLPPSQAPESLKLQFVEYALARGNLDNATTVLRQLAHGSDRELSSGVQPKNASQVITNLKALVRAVSLVLSDDVTPGMKALVRLSADSLCSVGIQWVARLWAARGAIRRGEGSRAIIIARDAHERAKTLGASQLRASECTLAEALVLGNNPDSALSLALKTQALAEAANDPTIAGRAWMVEAEVLSLRGEIDEALEAALVARHANPNDPAPILLMARLAIESGQFSKASEVLAGADCAEATWLTGVCLQLQSNQLPTDEAQRLLKLFRRPPTSEIVEELVAQVEQGSAGSEAIELLAIGLRRLGRYQDCRSMCALLLERAERVEAVQWILNGLPSANDTVTERPVSSPRASHIHHGGPTTNERTQSDPGDTIFSGDLGQIGLPEVLEFLRVGRRSGTLLCQSTTGTGGLRLCKGNIVAAKYLSREPDSRQCENAYLAAFDLEYAAVLSTSDLEDLATFVVSNLISWTEGQFGFEPLEGSCYEEFEFEADCQFVLLEVYKKLDESNAHHSHNEASSG